MKNLLFFLVMAVSLFISCSPDEEDTSLDVSLPIIQINDTIYAPLFTEGAFKPKVFWGGEIGNLSIISDQPGIKIFQNKESEWDNMISWDNSLGLGSYPATVIASNTAGEASKKLVFQIYVGGTFTISYSLYPDGQSFNSAYTCEFDSKGNIYYIITDDMFPSSFYAGSSIWQENNVLIFTRATGSSLLFPEELKSFKVTLSYDDEGVVVLSGYWYTNNQPIEGQEGGYIEFKKIIWD